MNSYNTSLNTECLHMKNRMMTAFFLLSTLLVLSSCNVSVNEASKYKIKFLSNLENRCKTREKKVTVDCDCLVNSMEKLVSAEKLIKEKKKSKKSINDYLKAIRKEVGDSCDI